MAKQFRLPFNMNYFHIIGLLIAFAVVIGSYILFGSTNPRLFSFLAGIAFVIGGLPFFISIILQSRNAAEKETMFLEFARALVESVKSGTPISKSIINIKNKDYGVLGPHVSKLANQISLGIPLKTSLETFARDIRSITITRAVNIISESEKAGGKIDDILDAVVKSVSNVEKLRKERTAAIYTLVVQGYIIFLIFIVIMLVMQFKILPIAAGMGSSMEDISTSGIGTMGGLIGGERATPEQMARPFLWLLIVQGLFAGLVIGKLAEGSVRAGLKHSFILIVLSLLIQTGANLFFGNPIAAPTG